MDQKLIYSNLSKMGFNRKYIDRAFRIYQKNYGHTKYNLSLLTEIIIRLQAKDLKKKRNSPQYHNISSHHYRPPPPQHHQHHQHHRHHRQHQYEQHNHRFKPPPNNIYNKYSFSSTNHNNTPYHHQLSVQPQPPHPPYPYHHSNNTIYHNNNNNNNNMHHHHHQQYVNFGNIPPPPPLPPPLSYHPHPNPPQAHIYSVKKSRKKRRKSKKQKRRKHVIYNIQLQPQRNVVNVDEMINNFTVKPSPSLTPSVPSITPIFKSNPPPPAPSTLYHNHRDAIEMSIDTGTIRSLSSSSSVKSIAAHLNITDDTNDIHHGQKQHNPWSPSSKLPPLSDSSFPSIPAYPSFPLSIHPKRPWNENLNDAVQTIHTQSTSLSFNEYASDSMGDDDDDNGHYVDNVEIRGKPRLKLSRNTAQIYRPSNKDKLKLKLTSNTEPLRENLRDTKRRHWNATTIFHDGFDDEFKEMTPCSDTASNPGSETHYVNYGMDDYPCHRRQTPLSISPKMRLNSPEKRHERNLNGTIIVHDCDPHPLMRQKAFIPPLSECKDNYNPKLQIKMVNSSPVKRKRKKQRNVDGTVFFHEYADSYSNNKNHIDPNYPKNSHYVIEDYQSQKQQTPLTISTLSESCNPFNISPTSVNSTRTSNHSNYTVAEISHMPSNMPLTRTQSMRPSLKGIGNVQVPSLQKRFDLI